MQAPAEESPTSLAAWVDLGSIEEDIKSEDIATCTESEDENDSNPTHRLADSSKRPNKTIKPSTKKSNDVKTKRKAKNGDKAFSSRRKRQKPPESGLARARASITSEALVKRPHHTASPQPPKRRKSPRALKLESAMDLAELCMHTHQWSEDLNRQRSSLLDSHGRNNLSEVSVRLQRIIKSISDSISAGRTESESPVLPLELIFEIIKNLCQGNVMKSEAEAIVAFLHQLVIYGLMENVSFSFPIRIKDRILEPLIHASDDGDSLMTKVVVEEVVKRILRDMVHLLGTSATPRVISQPSKQQRAVEICCVICDLFPLLGSGLLEAFSSEEIKSIKCSNILFRIAFDALEGST